jgi:hypothetical protein
MSNESAFVANVKTSKGTIITIRGDEWDTFTSRVSDAVAGNVATVIGALEDVINPMSVAQEWTRC